MYVCIHGPDFLKPSPLFDQITIPFRFAKSKKYFGFEYQNKSAMISQEFKSQC
jgi:hypothetical protein